MNGRVHNLAVKMDFLHLWPLPSCHTLTLGPQTGRTEATLSELPQHCACTSFQQAPVPGGSPPSAHALLSSLGTLPHHGSLLFFIFSLSPRMAHSPSLKYGQSAPLPQGPSTDHSDQVRPSGSPFYLTFNTGQASQVITQCLSTSLYPIFSSTHCGLFSVATPLKLYSLSHHQHISNHFLKIYFDFLSNYFTNWHYYLPFASCCSHTTTTCPILQVRKLRKWQVKQLAQDHTALHGSLGPEPVGCQATSLGCLPSSLCT